jgi:tetratricopeptide (TPR) repeat protein
LDQTLKHTYNGFLLYHSHFEYSLKRLHSCHYAVNGNYAAFLNYTRNDYDKAEIHYKRALKFDPNNVAVNGNYASFLTHIHKDYDQAKKYYKKALELDSNHANTNGNYAQCLLIQGKESQATVYLNKAFEFADKDKNLLIDLWFYRLAHYPAYRVEAIKHLDDLLEAREGSMRWDFLDGHPTLIFTSSYPHTCATLAALAISCGSLPPNCNTNGCSPTSKSNNRPLSPYKIALAVTISVHNCTSDDNNR